MLGGTFKMNMELKNDLLNLPQIQLEVDTIVFDSIDSTPNWSKAYEQLEEMLQKVTDNFNSYIASNKGVMPKASTYWTLYMDVASKILYFTSLAQSHLVGEQDIDQKASVLERYQVSLSCLPNATLEDNVEFISEIKKSMEQLTGQPVDVTVSEKTDTCIEKFAVFAKSYK